MNRRAFWRSLAAALAVAARSEGVEQSTPARSPRQTLARILGLRRGEEAWLDDLTAAQQQELVSGLSANARPDRKTVDLLYRVLGRRERLFPYVGYPPLPNRLTACDGLLRE